MKRLTLRRVLLGILMLLAIWTAVGCASVGRPFPTAAVEDIQVGQTSRDEIRQWFGPPWRTGLENGKTIWTYAYYRYRLFRDPISSDLLVRFDDQGTVADYRFKTTATAR